MRASLLVLLTACGVTKTTNEQPPAPTNTTALLFMSDFVDNYQVDAVDVATHASGTALAAADIGSNDVLLRAFGSKLYVVGRSLKGENNLTVLALDAGYKPSCAAGGGCQFPLGIGFNAPDFWAVSATKAYLTSQPDPFSPDKPQYALRNTLVVMNPETGSIDKKIDLEAEMKEAGFDLSSEDTDGYYGFASLYATSKHLFISVQMLDGFSLISRSDACGAVASRVAVLDLDTDKIVKVIKLRGNNVATRFVAIPGSDDILISTTGSQLMQSIDPCNGIERINTKTLELKTALVSEEAIGGSVMSFAVDKDGAGIAFLYTAGDYNSPTYEVRRFDSSGSVGAPIDAPGAGVFAQNGFVVANDRGEAYVGLPFAKSPKLQIVDMASGAELDSLTLSNHPIDVALFPGTPYSR